MSSEMQPGKNDGQTTYNVESKPVFPANQLPLSELINTPVDATSRNGRPLFEKGAPQATLDRVHAAGIIMADSVCPFQDSRAGVPMHASAMQAMQTDWNDILNSLGWIHYVYFKGKKPTSVSLKEAEELTLIAQRAPVFAMKRATDPYSIHGELPDEIAGVFKISRGVMRLLKKSPKDTTPDGLYTVADTNNLLVIGNEACAASPRRIVQALEALYYGKHSDPTQSKMDSYFPDPNALMLFSKTVGVITQVAFDMQLKLELQKSNLIDISSGPASSTQLTLFLQQETQYKRSLHEFNDTCKRIHKLGNFALGRKVTTPLSLEESNSFLTSVLTDEDLQQLEGQIKR